MISEKIHETVNYIKKIHEALVTIRDYTWFADTVIRGHTGRG